MSRTTKAMLEEDNRILDRQNSRLRNKVHHLEEVNEILKTRQFGVGELLSAHSTVTDAIAHVVTDLRVLVQKL